MGGKGLLPVTMNCDQNERYQLRSFTTNDPLYDEPQQTYYTLSRQGQIVDVGGSWDTFAWNNQGFEATADYVIGRQLNDFLDGHETVSFLNAMTFACRRNDTPLEMICRCDTTRKVQLFRMKISPTHNDMLTIRHTQVLTRCLPAFVEPEQNRVRSSAPRCSICSNFRIGRVWVDPVSQPQTEFIATTHVICPECKLRARDALLRANMPASATLRVI